MHLVRLSAERFIKEKEYIVDAGAKNGFRLLFIKSLIRRKVKHQEVTGVMGVGVER